MIKPDFESAVVNTVFIRKDFNEALGEMNAYLGENQNLIDYESPMIICCSRCEETDNWHVSLLTDYWNDKRVIGMIKKKKIRGK